MDDLSDAVTSLKNLVARPGTFSTFYPETTDNDVLAVLVDGFAEAHLEGLLAEFSVDEDGAVVPGISDGQAAMVILFAAIRFMKAELFNRSTNVVYQAGAAHYETVQATNILRDILSGLEGQKSRVIGAISTLGANAGFYMMDQYLARSLPSGFGEIVVTGW